MDHFKNEMSTIEDVDKSFITYKAVMENHGKQEEIVMVHAHFTGRDHAHEIHGTYFT